MEAERETDAVERDLKNGAAPHDAKGTFNHNHPPR